MFKHEPEIFGGVVCLTTNSYPTWLRSIKANYGEEVDIFIFSGQKCLTIEDMYDLMSDIFDFPDWFGRNPQAMIDCMRAIPPKTRKALVLKVEYAFHFLSKESAEDLNEMLYFFSAMADEWAAGSKQGLPCDYDPKIFFLALEHKIY